MRRTTAILAGLTALILAVAAAAPAEAGYGAIAYDQNSGKEGASFDQPGPARANELALQACASPECRVHSVEPKGCGALATSDTDQAWGGADRETLDAAKRDAVAHCQTHTATGICAVRVSGCNQ
ncbi:MAG TPA: DUF4189 domain-containing protein [Stellaceae bacterium]|nr:DUF4189 domain-containing protein [Stellaceae bacterium]